MSLKIGIVGLPNVGKSTLFNALLKKQTALAANYPFATIEPNVGVVGVPDWRLEKLAEVVGGEKLPPIVPATVTFVDIAGLVEGAARGEGLGNKFLSHIREVDLIVHVLRAFEDVDVTHVAETIDFERDRGVVETELILADLETLKKQKEPRGVAKSASGGEKEEKERWDLIQKLKKKLDEGVSAREVVRSADERGMIKDLNLLTMKRVLYVVNTSEDMISEVNHQSSSTNSQKDVISTGVERSGSGSGSGGIPRLASSQGGQDRDDKIGEDSPSFRVDSSVRISAKIEAELASLTEEEQKEYLEELGLEKPGLERLIEKAYDMLGLISFLTAPSSDTKPSSDGWEVRAWKIKEGTTAQEAAGVIHTDFEKNFVKAQVADFEDFVEYGGWSGLREEGQLRLEGRDYVVQDGDVIEFKVNA